MKSFTYFDFLSKFGIGGAHPGGFHLTKELLSKEPILPNSTILDAGCGTGQTAAYLYQQFKANVYGLEINSIMINKAKKRFTDQQLPIHLIQGSIENLPFEDQVFDFIISESVLAFVNKEKALREFYRVLKKGGRLITNEMTINYPLGIQEQNEIKHFYELDSLLLEEDWHNLLIKCGFKNIQMNGKNHKTPPSNDFPEFHFSKDVELELFEILNQHTALLIKYQDVLSYRIITCSK